MKSSILRAGLALAFAASLSACGGGSRGELVLYVQSGTGITKDGLVLVNNGSSELAVPPGAPASLAFKDLIPLDSNYNVTIKSRPDNTQSCTVSGNGVNGSASGNSGAFNVTVYVSCVIQTHKLGGTVNGLGNATGLVLVNGADQVAIAPGSTTFQMAPVSQDFSYGITVLNQPSGLRCSVDKGIGTMGTLDINNIVVNCGPST